MEVWCFCLFKKGCAGCKDIETTKLIESIIMNEQKNKSNVIVKNALINAYGECQCPENAYHIYQSINHKSIVSHNAMLKTYVNNQCYNEALLLFQNIHKNSIMSPDCITYITLIQVLLLFFFLGVYFFGLYVFFAFLFFFCFFLQIRLSVLGDSKQCGTRVKPNQKRVICLTLIFFI